MKVTLTSKAGKEFSGKPVDEKKDFWDFVFDVPAGAYRLIVSAGETVVYQLGIIVVD